MFFFFYLVVCHMWYLVCSIGNLEDYDLCFSPGGGGEGGGETPIYKFDGGACQVLKKCPKRYQDLVLWVWLRDKCTNSKTTYLFNFFVLILSQVLQKLLLWAFRAWTPHKVPLKEAKSKPILFNVSSPQGVHVHSAFSKTRLPPELRRVLSCESLAAFLHFPLEEKGSSGPLLSALAGASKRETPTSNLTESTVV